MMVGERLTVSLPLEDSELVYSWLDGQELFFSRKSMVRVLAIQYMYSLNSIQYVESIQIIVCTGVSKLISNLLDPVI